MDPSSHFTNPPGVFSGPALDWLTEEAARDIEALDAVRRFVETYGAVPTQDSLPAAGMTPSERTVRKRFGSFKAAVAAAGCSRT